MVLCDEDEIGWVRDPRGLQLQRSSHPRRRELRLRLRALSGQPRIWRCATWGISPDPALGETLPVAALDQPYAGALHLLMPALMDEVDENYPLGFLFCPAAGDCGR